MKIIRIVKYVLWAVVAGIGVWSFWLLTQIRGQETVALEVFELEVTLLFFVMIPSMIVAMVLEQIERGKKWKAFVDPIKSSYAKHFADNMIPLAHTGFLSDEDAAYAAVAVVSFKAAWRDCVGTEEAYYDKSYVATSILRWHTKLMKAGSGEIPMILEGIGGGHS